MALEVFRLQYEANEIYHAYVNALHVDIDRVQAIEQIPFLPIEFFKTKMVTTTTFDPEIIFESSGTTGENTSRHYVKKLSLYQKSFLKAFELFYGSPSDWCIIALLPGYLERTGSSLVYMADHLVQLSKNEHSGFYLYEYEKLYKTLCACEMKQQRVLLIGVTFALLDFAEKYSLQLHHTTIMETGGMKGRREEITRNEMHDFLKKKLGVKKIHSEYGMTELLSQAYSHGDGIFYCPPWMKALAREENDPLKVTTGVSREKAFGGILNIIDLANIYSCSFIATDDIGKLYSDGSFEVLGRKDNSDSRGCSLLTASQGVF